MKKTKKTSKKRSPGRTTTPIQPAAKPAKAAPDPSATAEFKAGKDL